MFDFVKLFLSVLILPILPIILCGLVVSFSEKLFMKLVGRSGRIFVLATSIVGTPVHELGHAIMCFPFGHRIRRICLWNPKAPNGVLGYVDHTYNKKNLWHRIGSLFIGIGPILLGLAFILLVMRICFPFAFGEYYVSVLLTHKSIGGIFYVLLDSGRIAFRAITDSFMPIWTRIIGGILILCVCLHISLSPADIKNSMEALPFYALICLMVSVIVTIIGGTARRAVISALTSWCFIGISLYTVVFAGVIVLLIIGLLFFIIRKIFRR